MPSVILYDKIIPGMVLAAPILNRYGQTLLAPGIILDEKHLLMFKTWGIRHITIEGESIKKEAKEEVSQDLINLAKSHVKKRMLWEDFNPIEEDLFDAAVERVINIYSSSDLETGND